MVAASLPSPLPAPTSADPSPRGRLRQVAGFAAPVVRAVDRVLPVAGPAGALLGGGGLRRGSVVEVAGTPGAGATSVAIGLAAAAGAAGEWAVAVELAGGAGSPVRGALGGLAAFEAGVALERFAVVRGVTRERWPAVVAALLDCGGVVLAETPRGLQPTVAGRLAARARQQGAVIVALGAWPAGAARRLRASGRAAVAARGGDGALAPGAVRIRVDDRGGGSRRISAAG